MKKEAVFCDNCRKIMGAGVMTKEYMKYQAFEGKDFCCYGCALKYFNVVIKRIKRLKKSEKEGGLDA